MKICGVDKSKHGRIPFHVSSRRSFVRSNSARDEFVVIVNEWSALHNPLIAIFRQKSFKKKGSTKSREYRHRNRSSVNLPSFLLVGMRQNVCRLPGSVSIRSVLKSTEKNLVDFRSTNDRFDNVDIFLDRVMLIQKLSNENDEKNKISWGFVTRNAYFLCIHGILLSDRKIFSSLDCEIWFFSLNAIFSSLR